MAVIGPDSARSLIEKSRARPGRARPAPRVAARNRNQRPRARMHEHKLPAPIQHVMSVATIVHAVWRDLILVATPAGGRPGRRCHCSPAARPTSSSASTWARRWSAPCRAGSTPRRRRPTASSAGPTRRRCTARRSPNGPARPGCSRHARWSWRREGRARAAAIADAGVARARHGRRRRPLTAATRSRGAPRPWTKARQLRAKLLTRARVLERVPAALYATHARSPARGAASGREAAPPRAWAATPRSTCCCAPPTPPAARLKRRGWRART